MKKTYIAPAMECVEIKVQQMLAASAIGVGTDYSGEAVLAPEQDLDGFFDGGVDLDKFFD